MNAHTTFAFTQEDAPGSLATSDLGAALPDLGDASTLLDAARRQLHEMLFLDLGRHLQAQQSFLVELSLSADDCRGALEALSHEHLLEATGDLLAASIHAVKLGSVTPLLDDVGNWVRTLEELQSSANADEIVKARARLEAGDYMPATEALEYLGS